MSNEFKTPGWLKVGFAIQTVVICVCLLLFVQSRRVGDRLSLPMFGAPPLDPQPTQIPVSVSSDQAESGRGEILTDDFRGEVPMHRDQAIDSDRMPSPVESVAFEPPREAMEDNPPIELDARLEKPRPQFPTIEQESDEAPERAEETPSRAVGLNAIGGDAAGLGNIAIKRSLEEERDSEAEPPASPTRRFYEVRVGSPAEVAATIRELFSASAKVSADSGSRSVIVIAQETTHEQVAELINEINDRGLSIEKERLVVEQLREEEQKKREASQREAAATSDSGGGRPRTSSDANMNRHEGSTESGMDPRRFPADETDSGLDRQAKELAQRLRTAGQSGRPGLLEQLRRLTQQQFQHRQERRRVEFDSLTQRVDRLKDSYRRRQEHQAEIIERRINELLDPNADLRWDSTDENADRPSAGLRKSLEPSPKSPSQSLSQEEESQYDGRTYSQWLKTLEIDRSPDHLLESLVAINRLLKDADHQELSLKILRMIRNLDGIRSSEAARFDSLIIESLNLLAQLSPSVVVESMIEEIPRIGTRNSTRQFFDRVLEILAYPDGRYGRLSSGRGVLGGTAQITLATRDSIPQIRSQLTEKSNRIVTEFIAVADRGGDPHIKSDMMSNVVRILRISKQPLASYPDLVPFADEMFDGIDKAPQPVGSHHQNPSFLAAILFAQNNYRFAEVLQLAEKFTSDNPQPTNVQFAQAVQVYVAATSHDVTVVGRLEKLLETRWNRLLKSNLSPIASAGDPSEPDRDHCFCLIRALADVGAPAIGCVKLLDSIANSAASQIEDRSWYGGEVLEKYRFQTPPTLGIRAESAAQKIIEADKATTSGVTQASDAIQGTSTKLVSKPDAAETTYDGITYSQWLKLLETERKPEKLIAAIETCARLVVKGDERKVAHLIFLAEGVFEGDHWGSERSQAANIGWYALSELPGSIVVDELLVALRDRDSYQKGRSFQTRILAGRDPDGIVHQEIVIQRANEIIASLLNLVPETPHEKHYELIAAAISVWSKCDRPISDFTELPERVQQMTTEGVSNTSAPAYDHWCDAMGHLATAAPETPNLAINLFQQAQQHAPSSGKIVSVLKGMKRHAAPAVTGLVDLFESEAKRFSPSPPISPRMMFNASPRIVFPPESSEFLQLEIVGALGEIGTGDRGFELLSVLKDLAAPKDSGGGNPPRPRGGRGGAGRAIYFIDVLANAANQAIAKFPADYVPSTDPHLVSDYWKLNGAWQLTSTSLSIPVDDAGIRIRLSEFNFTSNKESDARQVQTPTSFPSSLLSALNVRGARLSTSIDQSKSPKRITLTATMARSIYEGMNPKPEEIETRFGDSASIAMEGLYDLNDDTLIIQISKTGQPAPEKISSEADEVPHDQVRLEFKRNPATR